MSRAKKTKGAAVVLRIDGEMTIYRAAELKQSVLAALEQGPELELDLAAVSELDTAGVQVLILAKMQAQAMQRTLRLVGHSTAVLDVLEELNLAAFFGDPLVIESPSAGAAA